MGSPLDMSRMTYGGFPMRTRTRLVGAAAVVAALAAGGSAFTDSNTGTSTSTAGYGSITATGGDVAAVHYTVDPTDATKLSGVTVDLAGDQTAIPLTVNVQWNGATSATTCGVGTLNGSVTSYVCLDEQSVATATSLAVTITNT
jgi:hypothetical protein